MHAKWLDLRRSAAVKILGPWKSPRPALHTISQGDRWPALSCVITFSHFITTIIIIIIIIIVIISFYYYFFHFSLFDSTVLIHIIVWKISSPRKKSWHQSCHWWFIIINDVTSSTSKMNLHDHLQAVLWSMGQKWAPYSNEGNDLTLSQQQTESFSVQRKWFPIVQG